MRQGDNVDLLFCNKYANIVISLTLETKMKNNFDTATNSLASEETETQQESPEERAYAHAERALEAFGEPAD